jgi:thiamine biosynthesis lipoprotein
VNRGRRRFLAVVAAAPGLLLPARLADAGVPRRRAKPAEWSGVALGADARLRIFHGDAATGRQLIGNCVSEIRRLESEFSLYDPDSALARLNRDGVLERPSSDFLQVWRCCAALHRATLGAFDPTVQALWELYAAHFARGGAESDGPPPERAARARARVRFGAVAVARERVALRVAGMGVTFNGIVQGYLTDRIAAVLAGAGIRSALIETGETYALGASPEGRPWQIGIVDPARKTLNRVLALSDHAVATSSPEGGWFEPSGRFHHLFDPGTGLCAERYASVTVTAARATLADGLSTAFSAMPLPAIAAVVESLHGCHVHLILPDGTTVRYGRA